jgi:hypothetical protein
MAKKICNKHLEISLHQQSKVSKETNRPGPLKPKMRNAAVETSEREGVSYGEWIIRIPPSAVDGSFQTT